MRRKRHAVIAIRSNNQCQKKRKEKNIHFSGSMQNMRSVWIIVHINELGNSFGLSWC